MTIIRDIYKDEDPVPYDSRPSLLKEMNRVQMLEDIIIELCDGDDARDIHWRTGIPIERCEEMYKHIVDIRSRRK